VALSQLVSHQFVLVSLLLTGIQLFGQDEQCLFLTLQLAFTHQKLQQMPKEQNGGIVTFSVVDRVVQVVQLAVLIPGAQDLQCIY